MIMGNQIYLLVFVVLVTCCMSSIVNAQFNSTLIKDVKTLLFTTNNYDKTIRPDDTVNVTTLFGIYTLNSLDIKTQVMESVMFLQFTWKDTRLDWSSNAQYSSISEIFTSEQYIWVPKVTILNSVDDVSILNDDKVPIQVLQDGTVVWLNGKISQTHCECDVRWYPFDTQTCGIAITTWGYYRAQIELNFATPSPVLLKYFHENGEWEYVDYSTEEQVIGLSQSVEYKNIHFQLKFRRRPSFYFLNYIMPLLLLACLLCVTFKLPADSGEKVGYTLTVLLTFTVYLSILLDNIPTTSQRTSLLGITLILNVVLSVAASIITIFVLRCHNKNADEEIPKWIIKFTEKIMNPVVRCNKKSCVCSCRCGGSNEINELNSETGNSSKMNESFVKGMDEKKKLTWQDIGRIIDAFCFRFFLFCFIFCFALLNMIYAIVYFTYS